jgi:hypothetical protein
LQHDCKKERQYLPASSYFSHYKNNYSESTINKTKINNNIYIYTHIALDKIQQKIYYVVSWGVVHVEQQRLGAGSLAAWE